MNCRSVAECDRRAAELVAAIRLVELEPDMSQARREARCKVYRRELDRVLERRLELVAQRSTGVV